LVTVLVLTSDTKVWNLGEVVEAIILAKNTDQDLTLDLNLEGPDFEQLNLLQYIGEWQTRTTVITRNAVQLSVGDIKFVQHYPHFIESTKGALGGVIIEKAIEKPIGMFISRSNVHRLYLSSYVYQHNLANQTYHYDSSNNFHKDNLGLEELIHRYGVESLPNAVHLISNSPILKEDKVSYPIIHPAHSRIHKEYADFLVELVCETYYTGRTFFPTEKTWRPIILETPFIVQGPQWYLHRLKDLGFKTFDQWWDEGYSEDPADYQPIEIVKIINFLANLSVSELNAMYKEMQPILAHNKKRFLELTSKDFEIFENDRY